MRDETHFGFRDVPLSDKQALVDDVFHKVARRSGPMNDLMSGGLPRDVPGLDALYELYSFNIVPALGRAIVGDAEPYRYLVESIRRFPRPNAFAEMMRAAGFARVSQRPMSGGIVVLHSGWRL